MMHVLDGSTGDELFGFIPGEVVDQLHMLSEDTFDSAHQYYVDGYVDAGNVGSVDLLVSGLGRGGKGYFALDLTAAAASVDFESDAGSIVKWEYTATSTGDSDLGYSYSRPIIVNTTNGQAVVFGNGYESSNGHAVLFIVFIDVNGNITGTRKIDTEVGDANPLNKDCNGLSTPALIDSNFDNIVDFVYAGDLLGNLWKFDLRDADPADWHVAFNNAGTPKPLFQAVSVSDGAGSIGYRQPITSRPTVSSHCLYGVKGNLVVFGTGRLIGDRDYSDQSVQGVYGIWDWADAWEEAGETSEDKFLGSFGLPADTTTIDTCRMECTTIKGDISTPGSCIAECNGFNECEQNCEDEELQCQTNCSSLRTLTNMDTILGTANGKYVTLLRQNMEWVGGLVFGADGTEQIFGETDTNIVDQVVRTFSSNKIDWFLPDFWDSANEEYNHGTVDTPNMKTLQSPKHVGWYFNLPANGERVVSDMHIVDRMVAFVTNIPSDSPCSSGGTSWVMGVDFCTGGNPDTPFFYLPPDNDGGGSSYINIGTPGNPHYVPVAALGMSGLVPGLTIGHRDGGADMIYTSGNSSGPGNNGNAAGRGVGINTNPSAGYGAGVISWRNLNWQ